MYSPAGIGNYCPIDMWQRSGQRTGQPLKYRVFSGNPLCLSPATTVVSARQDCYKAWDKHSMVHAIEAVIEEGMSIRKATTYPRAH